MGRKPRIEFMGGVYHVIQRGNNREYIFRKKDYKVGFLNIVKNCKEMMNYDIYGYVIMDNHYHIILRTHEVPLSKIMHKVNSDFSKYYNLSQKRSGHVFQDRYKGILVKDDKYLLSLLRYVHQNPVKANICKKVADYIWSSDTCYRNNINNKMTNIDFILNVFSLNRNDAIQEYIKFMDVNVLEESSDFEDILVIGEIETSSIDISIVETERKTLDEILQDVTSGNEIFDKIKSGSRKRDLTKYKKSYIKNALKSNYKMKEIGLNIGISEAAVYLLNSVE